MALTRLFGTALAIALIVAIFLAAISEPSVNNLVKNIQDHYLALTAALGALGTLSMAVIQTIKDLVPVMRWYQQIKTKHWLRSKSAEASAAAKISPTYQFAAREIVKQRLMRKTFTVQVIAPELYQAFYQRFEPTDEDTANDAEADLLRLATAGNRPAFYDLPIEQLCGQMNAASQVVLDYPQQHEPLLRCLASLAAPNDLAQFATTTLSDRVATLRNKSVRTEAEEDELRKNQQQLTDIRARIANQIHRSVDAFQIATGYRWQWYLRTASFLISFVISATAVALGVGNLGEGLSITSNWAAIVILGLMGGFLAPVTSDLQAIVRQIRTKT